MFNKHYLESAVVINDFIHDNCAEDASSGSMADHAAFAFVNALVEYFLAVYVMGRNCIEVYGVRSEQLDWCKKEMRKWRDCLNKTKSLMNNDFFDEWLVIFDDLYQIDSHMDEI